MSFTPKLVKIQRENEHGKTVRLYRAVLLTMTAMVLLSFAASNVWSLLWQQSEWLTSTILPAVVVDLTNSQRQAVRAGALSRNPDLDRAAQLKAEHMAEHQYFAHYSPDGVTPWHWFGEVEYTFAHAGENLAVHFTDSRALVQAWLDSPTHRANIENRNFTEIGIGVARGRFNNYDTTFVVQLFGTPAVPRPTATDSATVAATSLSESEEEQYVELATTTENNESLDDSDYAIQVAGATTEDTKDTDEYSTEEVHEEQVVFDDMSVESESGAVESADTIAETETMTLEGAFEHETTTELPALYTMFHASSSGLEAATTTTFAGESSMSTPMLGSMATQPSAMLQILYVVFSIITFMLIVWSVFIELSRRHLINVAFSFALLLAVAGLWYLHSAAVGNPVLAII